MKIKRLSLAIISVLLFPVVSRAQAPNFTNLSEAEQYFEQKKGMYRAYVNGVATKWLDDPETPDIDESANYKQQLRTQQNWDDNKLATDKAQGRYFDDALQSFIDSTSENCPEDKVCYRKIEVLDALAYQKQIDCESHSENYTQAELQQCWYVADEYTQSAQRMRQTCTTTYPKDEGCEAMVKAGQQNLQNAASGYSGPSGRPSVPFEIPYPDDPDDLANAYAFDRNERLTEDIRETGTRNMDDGGGNKINSESDVQNYFQNYYGPGTEAGYADRAYIMTVYDPYKD